MSRSTVLASAPVAAPDTALAVLALAQADAASAADAMHDGALQSLVVARYAADAVLRGGDPALVREAVQEALVALRHAVWALRPHGAGGLAPALAELSGWAAACSQPPLRVILDERAGSVHDALGMTVFRFVQALRSGASPATCVQGTVRSGRLLVEADGHPADIAGWRAVATAHGGALLTRPGSTVLSVPLPTAHIPRQVVRTAPPPKGPDVTTVLICDDHRIVREGLRTFVERVPGVDKVETAASGEEVLARYGQERPDLILMDVRMPGLGGLEATRRLVAAHPTAKVIMLTAADDRDQVAAAVSHGARGYLLKDVSHEQLCAAVAHALEGADLVEPSLRRALANRDGAVRTMPPGGQLTERELQVLTGMSQGKSNGQIGKDLYLSEDTIKTHARRLFRKLGVNDRAQAVALGFRRGLVT